MVNGALIASLVVLSLSSMATAGLLGGLVSTPSMKVQGSIFCLSDGNKVTPLQGATVKIVCKTLGGNPYSYTSGPANDHGFYTATASGIKLVSCKAYINSSPWSSGCRVPTDINSGRKGAPLIAISPLSQLFNIKPFFYAPK